MHISGVPAGSLGPNLTLGQVWEGRESAACFPFRSSLALGTEGSRLHFWEVEGGLDPQLEDSPAPRASRLLQHLSWDLSLLHSGCISLRHKDSSVKWGVGGGALQRPCNLQMVNWANRGAILQLQALPGIPGFPSR